MADKWQKLAIAILQLVIDADTWVNGPALMAEVHEATEHRFDDPQVRRMLDALVAHGALIGGWAGDYKANDAHLQAISQVLTGNYPERVY